MLCACHRRSRASLHRLSFSMTCISWPVRLCSAADCSSAAATGPARSAVKCVDKEKGRSNGSFSLRPLSSLERFCVRHMYTYGGQLRGNARLDPREQPGDDARADDRPGGAHGHAGGAPDGARDGRARDRTREIPALFACVRAARSCCQRSNFARLRHAPALRNCPPMPASQFLI